MQRLPLTPLLPQRRCARGLGQVSKWADPRPRGSYRLRQRETLDRPWPPQNRLPALPPAPREEGAALRGRGLRGPELSGGRGGRQSLRLASRQPAQGL